MLALWTLQSSLSLSLSLSPSLSLSRTHRPHTAGMHADREYRVTCNLLFAWWLTALVSEAQFPLRACYCCW
ncbi:hypothetical protein K431DRAFT_281792 [Polychaeton citri CBS 116435]|uniref:Secreted protein n=1 Tax=Polychaeton citri CBS 116435 TaxID=1314669 RepID=A0A9P4UTK6_9PEZI|nr:hypothetical protein K431DRAFT_281792 [Polychaeton citri CBS 116435]